MAKSIVDYVFRWLALKFLTIEEQRTVGLNNLEKPAENLSVGAAPAKTTEQMDLEDEEENLFTQKVEVVAKVEQQEVVGGAHTMTFDNSADAPACDTCGSIMVRNGACYKCLNCGSTSGCS